MSLLQQDPDSSSTDTASRGEELTKGSTHLVWAAVIATLLVTVAIGIYVWAGQKPPAATGAIEQVWARPLHTETSGFDASGAAMPKETFDQVLVFTRVTLHNQSQKPLFLHQVMANATMDDGIHSSYAASQSDYERVFAAHPEMSALHGNGLPLEATINPGQSLEGTFVSAFRMNKQQWDARKSLNFTFAFEYQPSLVLAPQSAVIEQ
jgi:hypothetical protein